MTKKIVGKIKDNRNILDALTLCFAIPAMKSSSIELLPNLEKIVQKYKLKSLLQMRIKAHNLLQK